MASKLGFKREGAVSTLSGIHKVEKVDGVVVEVVAKHPVYGRVAVVFSRDGDGFMASVSVKSRQATQTIGPVSMDRAASEFFLAQLGAVLDGES